MLEGKSCVRACVRACVRVCSIGLFVLIKLKLNRIVICPRRTKYCRPTYPLMQTSPSSLQYEFIDLEIVEIHSKFMIYAYVPVVLMTFYSTLSLPQHWTEIKANSVKLNN